MLPPMQAHTPVHPHPGTGVCRTPVAWGEVGQKASDRPANPMEVTAP